MGVPPGQCLLSGASRIGKETLRCVDLVNELLPVRGVRVIDRGGASDCCDFRCGPVSAQVDVLFPQSYVVHPFLGSKLFKL